MTELKERVEKQIDTLEIKKNDIIILKGEWTEEEVRHFATLSYAKNVKNIIVVLSDEKSIESMPTEDFFKLLKTMQKQRKFDEGSMAFFAETSLIPMISSETGSVDEKIEEVIICESISGGTDYDNNMPEKLHLVRKTKDGEEYEMSYIQDQDYIDELDEE